MAAELPRHAIAYSTPNEELARQAGEIITSELSNAPDRYIADIECEIDPLERGWYQASIMWTEDVNGLAHIPESAYEKLDSHRRANRALFCNHCDQ
jgi:hypothetical protein